MLTPFAPFFVLFCHVIETLAVDDLELLQEFVASLEPMRDASQTADKLYRVFQLYCEVAVVYIGAKKRQQEDQSLVSLNDEMDMYLGQLGFMPMDDPSLGSVGGGGNAGGPMPMGGGAQGMQTAQMASWLTGSRDMLELLESDLPNMDGSRWMPPGSGSGM